MGARQVFGVTTVVAMIATAGVQAQQRDTRGDSGMNQPQPAQSQQKTVTVVGCVQKESDVLNTRGLGVGDEYVLTNVTTGGPSESGGAAAPPQAAQSATGTGSTGAIYTLTGDREDDMEQVLGKRVEVTGRLEQGNAPAAGSAPAGTPNEGTAADTTGTSGTGTSGTATSGTAATGTATSGAATGNDEDTAPSATNTGSARGMRPGYEGTRSPEERAGIEARRRAESLPGIEITSFREVAGNCSAPVR